MHMKQERQNERKDNGEEADKVAAAADKNICLLKHNHTLHLYTCFTSACIILRWTERYVQWTYALSQVLHRYNFGIENSSFFS